MIPTTINYYYYYYYIVLYLFSVNLLSTKSDYYYYYYLLLLFVFCISNIQQYISVSSLYPPFSSVTDKFSDKLCNLLLYFINRCRVLK